MKAYRLSVNLKLGLVIAAVAIAVASVAYTNWLANQLRAREQFLVRLWAAAQEQLASAEHINPYLDVFQDLEHQIDVVGERNPAQKARYREALAWARSMPPAFELTLASEIVLEGAFDIPAIITDSSGQQPLFWRNVPVPEVLTGLSRRDSAKAQARLAQLVAEMDRVHAPIPIRLRFGEAALVQQVHYGESRLVRQLRIFPYIQLFIVGLFILVGYLGFSYVRRSEQRSLWVGMAKEAAHQLGTPLSSLMGWIEWLRSDSLTAVQQREALDEIEKDIDRLRRVAQRFSEIGSLPRLERQPLAPVLQATADYIRRRMPSLGKQVALVVEAPEGLELPLNAELFEWVIENLLKNALDAIEGPQGEITVRAYAQGRVVHIDVRDTGKGIERRQWKHIFRPGYSTKKRGWGLGLSLAKRIVEDYHGGTIALVHSKPGQGSTFRITLPLR
ncbi:sensor histidine kinase [Rhodothermus bifroesti]|uniref:histidine kinase n=1 Tax=Rhodothermus marinus TaxID=29549 RepID=A0A7V2B0Y7_RHOMR|nr:HAMP domain-containing sensor histidine kinase [Rhodothermus bifroesti]GBD00999.1 Sensor protein ZraS [bacterium HR18]